MNLLMEEASPIFCSIFNEDQVRCACSDSTSRYDLLLKKCVSACTIGYAWVPSQNEQGETIIDSEMGTCSKCEVGTYGTSDVGWIKKCKPCDRGYYSSKDGETICTECEGGLYTLDRGQSVCQHCLPGKFSEFSTQSSSCLECPEGRYSSNNYTVECEPCPTGLYTSQNGSTSCETCPAGSIPEQDAESKKCTLLPAGQFGSGALCAVNTFSGEGSAYCTKCPSGKYSNTGASHCITCDFMFHLSSHCEFPVAGMLLIASVLIVVVVTAFLFDRYRRKQQRIQEKLRIDLYRQRQLVKTKQTDINLLTSAKRLSLNEVRLDKRLAAGTYGEVWKGALHLRWVVAIKKLFPIQATKRKARSSSSKSKSSSSSKHLFLDSEIRFLMRTHHERLVMFLGCGISNDGGYFLVMEYMDGT